MFLLIVVSYAAVGALGLLCWRFKVPLTFTLLALLSTLFLPHALLYIAYADSRSVSPNFVYENFHILRRIHQIVGAGVVALLFAATLHPSAWPRHSLRDFFVLAAVPVAGTVGGALIGQGLPNDPQDFFSILAMFVVIYAFVVLLSRSLEQAALRRAYVAFLVVALLSFGVSCLEIATIRYRAATVYEVFSPEHALYFAYRAAGLFNNPNWQGNWAVLFGLISLWLYRTYRVDRLAIFGAFVAGLLLYYSGSRGAAFALVAALMTYALVLLGQVRLRDFAPIAAMAGAAALAIVSTFVIVRIAPESRLAESLYGLEYRWVVSSFRVFDVWLNLAISSFTGGDAVVPQDIANTPEAYSAAGRISSGEGADNGFVVMWTISGLGGFFAAAMMALIVFWHLVLLTVAALRSGNRINLAFSCSLAVFVLLLPMQLRAFSVFPIWIFEAFALASVICLERWDRSAAVRLGAEGHMARHGPKRWAPIS